MNAATTWVVAGALQGEDARWLMHRRPPGKPHAGLWEFPGGKVEPSEIPANSLVRELREELGISVRPIDCRPACFAEEMQDNGSSAIVILLYIVERWSGVPDALEGGEISWFTRQEIANLNKPPLDIDLANKLFS